jgi:FixJ family two-component response regulator
MLFTGFMDFEALVEAINDGRIIRFLRKPWTVEELEQAMGEAAAEYDRIVEHEDRVMRVRAELRAFGARIAELEREDQLLRVRAELSVFGARIAELEREVAKLSTRK